MSSASMRPGYFSPSLRDAESKLLKRGKGSKTVSPSKASPVQCQNFGMSRNKNQNQERAISTAGSDIDFGDNTDSFSVDTQNIQSQLDDMLKAVQTDNSAVRERIKESETQRYQLQVLAKKLLETEQVNETLKKTVNSQQEIISEMKREKNDTKSAYNTIKVELDRLKESSQLAHNEKLALQQEHSDLLSQTRILADRNDSMERANKQMKAIEDTNTILQTELRDLKRRYKEDRVKLQNRIRSHENRIRTQESTSSEVKSLALRIADLCASSSSSFQPNQTPINSAPSIISHHSMGSTAVINDGMGGGIGMPGSFELNDASFFTVNSDVEEEYVSDTFESPDSLRRGENPNNNNDSVLSNNPNHIGGSSISSSSNNNNNSNMGVSGNNSTREISSLPQLRTHSGEDDRIKHGNRDRSSHNQGSMSSAKQRRQGGANSNKKLKPRVRVDRAGIDGNNTMMSFPGDEI